MAEDLVAEIVASVLEVLVTPGQEVEAGDTVVLLESMKMEIPVLAEEAGTIADVRVNVGDVIQAGDVIATFDDPTA
ncbi:Biotinylated protein TB7.3 [Gordonia paraffinivorans]|uniref:Biotinylated protein TB7.3 n=1 Tax=Gordonia paraffinivorans TaxID=175628 RepID=A0ABD7V0U1_9ACTN|nr:biotin/lipoyl-binding carrier protein [Gordonia paraffinivorans]VFA87921.1 Biotinylated protein TB7.3 [Gordonia paraffinivorans]